MVKKRKIKPFFHKVSIFQNSLRIHQFKSHYKPNQYWFNTKYMRLDGSLNKMRHCSIITKALERNRKKFSWYR